MTMEVIEFAEKFHGKGLCLAKAMLLQAQDEFCQQLFIVLFIHLLFIHSERQVPCF